MSSNYPMTELSMVVLLSFGVATLFVTCAEGNNFDTCPLHWWSIPNERCVRVFPLRKTLKEAADICRLFKSELLSAGQELDELQDYISPIATSVAVSQLLLGVTDPWGTGVFLWLDGSLFDDSVWADHYPKPSGGRCAVFRTEERDLVNVHCTGNNAFICQKSRVYMRDVSVKWKDNVPRSGSYYHDYPSRLRRVTGCYNAWDFGMYLSSVAPLETDVLTLQVCVQVCRGRHVDVAAAWRGQCYCFSSVQMSLMSRTEIRRCDTACPGDNDQRCGDEFGQYLNLLDMRQYEDVAGTCADLYRQGVRIPGPYLLHRDEDSSPLVQNCFYTELRVNAVPRLELAPEDWQYWRGNFYQFLVASQNAFSVDNAGCFKEGGGYLTSVLSQDELDFIATTIRGSPLFAPVDQWLVGLTDVTQSGFLRWAGPVLFDNKPPFSNQCTAATLCCVVRTDDSVILRDCYRTPNTTWGYICKQERGFRGCRRLHLTSMEFLHIADSGDMTALLCKELCRGNLSELAVVSGEDCYCATEIPSSTELMTPDHCDIPCSGHADQMCAGGGLALWYNVDKDKVESVELATDCDQFLYNGINTSDTLLLRLTADNGQDPVTQSACGIDTDLEQTLTSSTSQTMSLTLLSLSKQQGPVISSAPVIQDVWESPLWSVGYASRDVSISRYISTTPVLPTSTLTPSIMDSTPGLKLQSPVWSDPSSSGPTYLQSPCRSSVSSVGFSSLITGQEMDSTVVGEFLEQSANSRSVIVKGTETPLILTSMRSPISETRHTTNHPDTLYSISTSAFISNKETTTSDQGLATDGDPGITGVESETISSSTTDNSDPGITGVESETISSSTTDNGDPGITGVESETISSSTTDNGDPGITEVESETISSSTTDKGDPGITGVESETISSSTTDNGDPGITGVESETITSSTTDNGDPGITGVESETISSSTTDNGDPGITGVESETISSSTTDNGDPGITGVESETISSSTTDNGNPGITGVESETISSSTTDNGDLLHPTSESVTPSSTKRQSPSDTTTAPTIAAAPSEAVMSSITNSSYIYTCSSYYSENEASSCPCLRMLTNAVASSCHASSGASVVLTCRVGWGFPEGQSNLTVQCWDATWTPEPLHCVPGKGKGESSAPEDDMECVQVPDFD